MVMFLFAYVKKKKISVNQCRFLLIILIIISNAVPILVPKARKIQIIGIENYSYEYPDDNNEAE